MTPYLVALTAELGICRESLIARGLEECEEAFCLEVAEVGADGKDHLLVPAAADAWRRLKAAARCEDISLSILSAFRSVDRQAEIIRRKLVAGVAIDDVLTVCAPPGFSEHHTGRAIDVSAPGARPLELDFERTPEFVWLSANAADFGYYMSYPIGNSRGYQYEPWHWCFQNPRIGA